MKLVVFSNLSVKGISRKKTKNKTNTIADPPFFKCSLILLSRLSDPFLRVQLHRALCVCVAQGKNANCPSATLQLRTDPWKIKECWGTCLGAEMIYWLHLPLGIVTFCWKGWGQRKTISTTRLSIKKSPYCKTVHQCHRHNLAHGHRLLPVRSTGYHHKENNQEGND